MQTFKLWRMLLTIFISCASHVFAADTNVPPRLTIELQDGSRIVGTNVEKSLRFHSALLGDLKLQVKDIRSIDCVSSNAIKLTTASGDSLAASFVDPELTVKTSFGRITLETSSVRHLTVSGAGGDIPEPEGLVAFWSGDSQGKDPVSGADAELMDVGFGDGLSGQAFSFNGISSRIRVPASPALDVGAGDGFTIMAWIKPSDVYGLHPICQWLMNGEYDDNALQFWIGLRPDENGVLRVSLPGGDGNCFLVSQQGVLVRNVFQHIAVTYDKRSGMGMLYVNGVMVCRKQLSPGIVSNTKWDFWLSPRDDRPGNWSTGRMYSGLMDDIALFNRALSQDEIQSVCTAESQGQHLILPTASTGWWDLMQ